jgi:uncharacterized protein (DUF433 family)
MQKVVIDCPYCKVRVEATTDAYVGGDISYFLVKCPSCDTIMLGSGEKCINGLNQTVWDTLERLWPNPALAELATTVPQAVRRDIKEAQQCILHGIYSAAAVLCGRALERLIKEKAGNLMIAKGIAELKAQGVIDQRLFDWAEALRKERNIGAHASEHEVSAEDAQDVLDFTVAIFDYVYTLSDKYEKYLARKQLDAVNNN